MKEIKAAIKTLLEIKACVVYDITNGVTKTGSWHLYANSNGYTILHFDNKSDWVSGDEEHFEVLDDAITKFVTKINIPKGKAAKSV